MTATDPLAFLDALIAQHESLSADAYHAQQLPKAKAVRSLVGELIASARYAVNVDRITDSLRDAVANVELSR